MARPLRIEFPGAVYHLTSRGDRREAIFVDDEDRQLFLDVLAQGCRRMDACVLAYCLMGNHYHLVLHTRAGQLSRFMRHLNGVYTQAFNRRHGVLGHLFQGRFKAVLVDTDAYLMALCRYVELNPVRARVVADVADWPWSSYGAHTARVAPPPWLDVGQLQAFMLQREPRTVDDRLEAMERYAQAVAEGLGEPLWRDHLRQQVYLGDEGFVKRMQAIAEGVAGPAAPALRTVEVPRAQRASPLTLDDWLARCPSREEALMRAHGESGLTMSAMAQALGLSVSRVSRLIKRAEGMAPSAFAGQRAPR